MQRRHIDPGGWYHWHATSTDIHTVFQHAHIDATYPYHASLRFPNLPACLRCVVAKNNFSATAKDLGVTEAALKAARPRPPGQ